MNIACVSSGIAQQVLGVLKCHGVTRGISWWGPDGFDTSTWIVVYTTIDPQVAAAIRRDIASIDGAAVQE